MSLLDIVKVRRSQGTQYIPDVRTATPAGFTGRPLIASQACADGCSACKEACPTRAIELAPVTLDLGRCVFCTECSAACPDGKITFTSDPHLAATERSALVVSEGQVERLRARAFLTFSKLFGRSLKLRQVSAGGCNACELELNAIANVNFDVQRFGIEWVASPRHADALVVTGPLTTNMRDAVRLAWDAMPEPRFVVAVGACAISGGLHAGSAVLDRTFLDDVGPALFVPGCPPHPLTFVNAVLDLLGRR